MHSIDSPQKPRALAQRRALLELAFLAVKSPCATAPITRATSLVGCTRSSISELIDSIDSPQKPRDSRSDARCFNLPCLPTTRRSRPSSSVIAAFCSTTSLKASATRPATPGQCNGSLHAGVALAQRHQRGQQRVQLVGLERARHFHDRHGALQKRCCCRVRRRGAHCAKLAPSMPRPEGTLLAEGSSLSAIEGLDKLVKFAGETVNFAARVGREQRAVGLQ